MLLDETKIMAQSDMLSLSPNFLILSSLPLCVRQKKGLNAITVADARGANLGHSGLVEQSCSDSSLNHSVGIARSTVSSRRKEPRRLPLIPIYKIFLAD